MKRCGLLTGLLILLFGGLALAADGEGAPKIATGAVGLAAMYDSNFLLMWPNTDNDGSKGDFIYSLDAKLGLSHTWASGFQTEFDLQGLANRPSHYTEDAWGMAKGNLYLGYNFGANTISAFDSARYVTTPDNDSYDLFRNTATLAIQRAFSRLWSGVLGYENILNHFPNDQYFDYNMNGGFIEIRNTWTPLFSTYYSFDSLWYRGEYNEDYPDRFSTPEAGTRTTGEFGFDLFFAKRHALKGTYSYQWDRCSERELGEAAAAVEPPPPEDRGRGQRDRHQHHPPPQNSPNEAGNFEGEPSALDIDAEFNYNKHKATLLYSIRFNERFSLSFYNEFIHKNLIEQDKAMLMADKQWTDRLFLTSVWFTARTFGPLYAKARYLFRMNDSTIDADDFQDHIFSLGLECRF